MTTSGSAQNRQNRLRLRLAQAEAMRQRLPREMHVAVIVTLAEYRGRAREERENLPVIGIRKLLEPFAFQLARLRLAPTAVHLAVAAYDIEVQAAVGRYARGIEQVAQSPCRRPWLR